MSPRELVARLRRANGQIRFFPGRSRGSALFIRHRDLEDPEDTGLKFLTAIPSPLRNGNIPKFNWIDEDGMFQRGLKECVRNLDRQRVGRRKVFPTELMHRICPGFNMGTCGPRPTDQPRLQAKYKSQAEVKRKMADLNAEVTDVQAYQKRVGVI